MIKKTFRTLASRLKMRYDFYVQSSKSSKSLKILESDMLEFQKIQPLIANYHDKIKHLHDKYVSEVSSEGMAISLNQSCFLAAFCEVYRPEKVLDLGSGFSSFLFRNFTQSNVTSIDDNKDWLLKTKEYLNEQNITFKDIFLWKDFKKDIEYDLVFHDMGNMDTRMSAFDSVTKLVKKGGFLFLDDVHKNFYRKYVNDNLDLSDFKLYNLYNITFDKYGRFMYLCVRNR